MCFRPTLGERTHMHAHTHANIYGVGVEVNVTSCSPASEWVASTLPEPSCYVTTSSTQFTLACRSLGHHNPYITPLLPQTRARTHTRASSSLQCQHQQHHSCRDSESGALQGPPPPPTFSPWCWSGQAGLVRLAAPPLPTPFHRSGCHCCDVTEACLSASPITLGYNAPSATAPCTSTSTSYGGFFLPSFWIHVNFLTFLAKLKQKHQPTDIQQHLYL